MNLEEQIKAAIGAHGMWKARLGMAIDTKSSRFSPATVRLDDQCDFGKWLRSVLDPSIKNSASYHTCTDLHRQFHQMAANVLEMALAGRKDAAKQAMGVGSDFGRVSASLTKAMIDWARPAAK